MTWKDLVLQQVKAWCKEHKAAAFTLDRVFRAGESIFRNSYPNNKFPRQKISEMLQKLEADRVVKRLNNRGHYELVGFEEIETRSVNLASEEVLNPAKYPEGATRRISVNAYERNRQARQECIRHHGVNCEVCGFNFELRFGSDLKGFIHVHHKKPLASIGKNYDLDPTTDLCPVCPNCHAVIHRVEPPYSIDQVRMMIKEMGGTG